MLMVGRLIAIAVALCMTGAPVVTTACEGLCATRANERGTRGEHHSCHQQASTTNETGITSAAHICGHSDEGPSTVGQSLWSLTAPAIPVAAFILAFPSVEAAYAGRQSGHGPPLISPRSAQLRI
jgi:hypothetical protein